MLGEYVMGLNLEGRRVLDIGSGSGLLALLAARGGASVVCVDINPLAVETSRQNSERNGLAEHILTIKSDLFKNVPVEQFDLIITNPPYYRRIASTPFEAAFNGGEQFEFFQELSRSAPRFLKPDGRLLMILSSDANMPAILNLFRREGFGVRELRKGRKLFEKLIVYELKVRSVR
jgi:release factor glutamine methyltransferase